MATAIYEVELDDSPNTGRLKINETFVNLKTTADYTATLLTGIGDPIGTTNVKELFSKTITSNNLDGTNIISISREDIFEELFNITCDTSNLDIEVNAATLTIIGILGDNGIETEVIGSDVYISHPQDTVLNHDDGDQTLTINDTAVTTGYTLDVNGYALMRSGISIGAHASLVSEYVNIAGTDNATPISVVLKNSGTAGTSLKLIKDVDTDYWFIKRNSDDDLLIGKHDTGDSTDDSIIFIDNHASSGTITISTGNKVGIANNAPAYSFQIETGLGFDDDTIYVHGANAKIIDDSGSIAFIIAGQKVFDVHSDQTIGIGGAANASYALNITGTTYASGKITAAGALDVAGLATFSGNTTVNNKFSVLATNGNVTTAGTLTVAGLTTLTTLNVSGDTSFLGGTTLKIDALQPVTSGITIKNLAGTAVGQITSAGLFNLGVSYPAGGSELLGVKGDVKFYNDASDNYVKFIEDTSVNYIQVGSTTTNQNPLYLQIAGTAAGVSKAFEIKQGETDIFDDLTTTLYVDSDVMSIMPGSSNTGYEILNIFNGTSRPITFKVDAQTWVNLNSYYSTAWKYGHTVAGSYVGAAQIGFDSVGAGGYLKIRTAPAGTKDGALTWATPAIAIDHMGNIGIQKDPDPLYDLAVAGAILSDTLTAGTITSTTKFTGPKLEITQGEGDYTSISTGGGITAGKTIAVNNLPDNVPAFKATAANNVSLQNLVQAMNSAGNVTLGSIAVGPDPANAAASRLVLAGGGTGGYVYADTFNAGSYHKAGYTKQADNQWTTPRWCPVPFLVYAEDLAGAEVGIADMFGALGTVVKTVSIPLEGLYRLTYQYDIVMASISRDGARQITVVTTFGTASPTVAYTHAWQLDVNGDGFIRYGALSGTITAIVPIATIMETMSITWSVPSYLDGGTSYKIRGVTLEWICPGSKFPA
ncbi:MAG TPA: hypothetical protein PKN48_00420 [Bacteroidales bacterium]|nr:hypothetical protein [Bacteroidales bacterium]